MMTIEQALALTPGGFKLTYFDAVSESATWVDRNGNSVRKFSSGYYAMHNGKMSQNYDNINQACAWYESKQKWWKDK